MGVLDTLSRLVLYLGGLAPPPSPEVLGTLIMSHLGAFLRLFPLFAALAGCATTSADPLARGSEVLVRLYDARQDLELALANESHPGLTDLYSQRRADGTLKLARDDLMGELVADLQRNGFGDYGHPSASPGAVGSYVLLELDGVRRVFREPGSDADAGERQAFVRMKLIMNYYYTHVGSLQFVDNPNGAEMLRDQERPLEKR